MSLTTLWPSQRRRIAEQEAAARRAADEAAAAASAAARAAAGALTTALPFPAAIRHPDGSFSASPTFHETLGLPAGAPLTDQALAAAIERAEGDPTPSLAALAEAGIAFSLRLALPPDPESGDRRRLEGRRHDTGAGSPSLLLTLTAEPPPSAATAPAQNRLLAMLDGLPLPVWLRGPDLRLQWANRACLAAVDLDLSMLLARQRELGAGVVGNGGRAIAMCALRQNAPCTEQHHLVVAGARRRFDITEQPLPEGAAGKAAILGYAIDSTELEDQTSLLGSHIAGHRDVLEHLASAIAIFGPDKRLVFYNQAFVGLWDLEESWLDTKPTLSELLEDLRQRRRLPEHADFPAYKKSQNALFTSLIDTHEELMHLPDGGTLRQVVTAHPFGGLLYIIEDVTDELTLERNYNTLLAVQRETIENLAEGIALYGGDGRLQLSNPAFAQMWSLSRQDLDRHLHVTEVLDLTRGLFRVEGEWTGWRDAMVSQALDRTAADGRLHRTDGAVLDYSTVPLPDGGVLYRFVDVTDSVRVEQALRASNEALETADRLKSEFIANVSYQLRTPLNAIMGFAEILNNRYFGPLNDRQSDYTESIIDASTRLLALVNDLLDLANIEAGYLSLERRPVDIRELLENVLDLTREWAAKQNLRVTIDCPDDIGTVQADERRLKQALYNLISNAIKFTLQGGSVTLRAERRPREIRLIVADTGIGIPEVDRNRVFGRFERSHPQLRQSGVGLGLALVKSFIEMHGGRVELDSRAGEGTTVTCILPVREDVRTTEAA